MRSDRDPPDPGSGLDAVGPDTDEELPARPERDHLLLRRLRRPVGYLVVAALVGLGVVKQLSLGGSGTPSARGTSVATRPSGAPSTPGAPSTSGASTTVGPSGVVSRAPAPSTPPWVLSTTVEIRTGPPGSFVLRSAVIAVPSEGASVVGLDPGSGELVSDNADTTPCPDSDTCSTAYDLPNPVLRALRTAYPGAVVTQSRTVSIVGASSTTLLGRSFVATAGGRTIHVRVGSQGLGPDDSGNHVEGPDRLAYADSSASGYEIDVLVVEPTSRPSTAGTALRLARNLDLTVPS